MESLHSPMQSELGDMSETPPFESPKNSLGKPIKNFKAIIAVNRFTQYSPLPSPGDRQKKMENTKFPSLVTVINRARREDFPPSVMTVGPIAGEQGQRSDSWGRKTKREEIDGEEDCARV
jgi:hypothetical protein